MTDSLFVGQVDGCDLMGGEEDAVLAIGSERAAETRPAQMALMALTYGGLRRSAYISPETPPKRPTAETRVETQTKSQR